MKTEYEQAVEWNCSLSDIEQIALEEKYLPKIERNGEICLDGTKQTKEWYIEVWKKETQEYNETFNPEAHSSLIIDFDKVETIEEIAQRHSDENHIIGDFYKLGFIEGVKWCKEQLKN